MGNEVLVCLMTGILAWTQTTLSLLKAILLPNHIFLSVVLTINKIDYI
jgi:hypothetical protein